VAAYEDGKDGSENAFYTVGAAEFSHGREVDFDLFERHGASVASEVVCTGEDDDGFAPEGDDARAKAYEHLRSGLTADAAADVGLAGEKVAKTRLGPRIGNGVAHEDDTGFVFGR